MVQARHLSVFVLPPPPGASPVDFLSRVRLRFTLCSTLELRPKRRRPLAWVTAPASPWSPDATLVHSSPLELAARMLFSDTNQMQLLTCLNSLMAPNTHKAKRHLWYNLQDCPSFLPKLTSGEASRASYCPSDNYRGSHGFSCNLVSLHVPPPLGSGFLHRDQLLSSPPPSPKVIST